MVVFASLSVLNITVHAQGNDPCSCNAVLISGVYSYRAERGDSEATQDVANFLAFASYEQFKKTVNAGGGFDIGGFGFSADMSEEEFHERQTQLRQYYHFSSWSKTSRDLVERYGDKNVLNAWATCKSTCNATGLLSWIEVNDANNLVLHLKWSTSIDAQPPQVQDSRINGGRVSDNSVAQGKVYKTGKVLKVGDQTRRIYRPKSKKAVTINISLKGADDVDVYVPKFIAAKEPATQPPAPSVTSLTWSALDLPIGHIIGKPQDGAWVISVGDSQPNFLSYGPYLRFTGLGAGNYVARWELLIDNNSANNSDILRLDVNDYDLNPPGTHVAEKIIRRTEWSAPWTYQPFLLSFTVPDTNIGHRYEFRVFWYGRAHDSLTEARLSMLGTWSGRPPTSVYYLEK
jgi:hypothetical protein